MIKKINSIFGYGFFAIGASKIILMFLIFIKVGRNITAIFNGGEVDSNYYEIFITVLGFAEIIIGAGSIIMIILNIKKQPGVISGYLLGLGALLLEILLPSLIFFFVECGMYMRAGIKIRNKNMIYEQENKTSKRKIKKTEWFYSNDNEQDENNNQNEIRKQKKIKKIDEEILEWKNLLETGEIDELTCNQEIEKLTKKKEKIEENS